MRILIWGNCYPRMGGVETFVANLAKALTERGVAVGVISDGGETGRVEGFTFPIWTVPMVAPVHGVDPVGILGALRAIRSVIDDFAPDVLLYNLSGAEIMLFDKVMRTRPIPAVSVLHNMLTGVSQSSSLDRLFVCSHVVVAVSAFVQTSVARILGRKAADMTVITNAIPTKPAPPPAPQSQSILSIGRIVDEKGFDTAVRAFAKVVQRHPEATLTIAGDGPKLAALRGLAADIDLGDAVRFVGWIAPTAVHAAMAAAAVVVVPSRWQEPFGLVAVEAGQAARPAVVTRVGALPSIIEDGVTGLVVEPEDPNAMAQAISSLLDAPDVANAMGARARQRMEEVYNFDTMVDAYVAVLEAAISARSRGG